MSLSYENTGKYTSERHEEAKLLGLKTAGEVAKELSKCFKFKVLAKDIKKYADEWHHSGFYKSNNKQRMGKTYFFSEDKINWLKQNYKI